MIPPDLLALMPAMVLSCIAVVEAFFRLPFMARVEAVNSGAMRALSVVRSPRISDHWKEKVLPRYAARILLASLGLGVSLAGCAVVFTGAWLLLAWWPSGGWRPALDALSSTAVQLWLLGLGLAWAAVRARLRGRGRKPVSDYSASSQMFHRLALGSEGMKSLADDLDRRIAGRRSIEVEVRRPVYVTALARAGTTVVLEALNASGEFASLTYRSMPFVMAPWTWGAVSPPRRTGAAQLKERAHGDRLKISVDSPEAFEEVFWSTWADRATRDVDGLRPAGAPDPAVIGRYRDFVKRILARDARGGEQRRYLCKNNNNLLRIPWLLEAFPDAQIVTPFRHPADHVQSLLRQHRRFLERHGEDPFSLEYMDWLGHHEFGRHFLPFKTGPGVVPDSPGDLLTPAYWVRYWTSVYRYLLDTHGERLIWLDYDRLCAEPGRVLAGLERTLGLEEGDLGGFADEVTASGRRPDAEVEAAMDPSCLALHEALRARGQG